MDLCTRNEFVRERGSAGIPDTLHLVTHYSTPFRLRNGQPLVFLDLDSPTPTLHFAVTGGRGAFADILALTRMKWMTKDSLDLPTPTLGAPVQQIKVEMLVDSQFFAFAKRLGLHLSTDDGVNVFSAVGVVSVPELNVVLVSMALTEGGRKLFQAFVDQGIAGMDNVLQWRVSHFFGQDVVVSSMGAFPCVKAGRRMATVEDLRSLEPALLELPVRFDNMVQLVNCR